MTNAILEVNMPASPSECRLSLIVIRAIDPGRLARFYSGLGMSFQTEQHGAGPLHYVSTDTGITFEIYPRLATQPDTTGTRLGFTTVALDTVLKALTSCEGQVLSQDIVTPWGRRAVVIDPEGHKVELTEQKPILDAGGQLTPAGQTWVESQRLEARAAFQQRQTNER